MWEWRRRGLLPTDSLRLRSGGAGSGGAGAECGSWWRSGWWAELGVELLVRVEERAAAAGWLELRVRLQ